MELDLYKNIGKLFYALAKADGQLALDEYGKLNAILSNNCLNLNPIFNTTIKHAFNEVYLSDAQPNSCYDDFIEFYKINPELFSKELKQLILKTANRIAYAFAKINKSELILLAKLNIEFKK